MYESVYATLRTLDLQKKIRITIYIIISLSIFVSSDKNNSYNNKDKKTLLNYLQFFPSDREVFHSSI